MPDLLDDILPVAPHPDVDFGMPPLDLDQIEADYQWYEKNAHEVTGLADARVLALVAEVRRLRAEHARPSLNGAHGYEATCHGCGAKITVKRRPMPGKHNWCETCTANGEPAAQRARDYRDRKREGRSE